MKKFIYTLLTFVITGVTNSLAIEINNPNTLGWTAIPVYDIPGDTRIGSGMTSIDIVGNSTYPSVYYQFTPSGDSIAVRIRVNDCDGNTPGYPEFHGFAYIGIDADLNGSVDFFLGAYNPTGYNLGRLGIYPADPAANNIEPGRTGISEPVATFQPIEGVNYSIITASGSSFSSNPDYFITFKFKVADITAAIAGNTAENVTFTAATPFTFIAGTATQDNAMNGDINGIDDINVTYVSWTNLFPYPFSGDGSTWRIVTFDMNGGDVDALPVSITVKNGTPITVFPARNPIRRGGWRFVGWSNIPNEPAMPPAPPVLTNPFNLGTIINADKTVYATWEDIGIVEDLEEHIVHFNPSGGSWPSAPTTYRDTITVDGSVQFMPPNPNSTGLPAPQGNRSYIFGGWVMSSKVYNVAGRNNVIDLSTNALLYDTIPYFISSQAANTLPEVYQSHSGEMEYTVYALWIIIANNMNSMLTFYDNISPPAGGKSLYISYVGNNSFPILNPAPLTRMGYVFRGWDTNPNASPGLLPGQTGATRYLDPLDPAKNITAWRASPFATSTSLYAIWQPANYTLEFLPNTIDYILNPLIGIPNGTFGHVLCPASDSIRYPAFPNPPPTLSTYKFVEWNTQPDGSGFAVDSFGVGLTISAGKPVRFTLMSTAADSITLINGARVFIGGYTPLYAIWDRDPNVIIMSTIKFDAMGGKHTMGAPYYELSDPLEEHHLLDIAATDGYLDYIPTPICLDLDDGKPIYLFAGWSFSDAPNRTAADPGILSWISDPRLLTNLTLYAVWIPVNTVIFHPRGGVWPDGASGSIKVLTDDQGFALHVPGYFDLPDNHPLLASYTFLEWNTEIDGSGDVYHRDTHAANGVLNVYAQWQGPPTNYTDIFYDHNDGTGERFSDRVLSGSLITPPPNPVRDGWRFGGWFLEPGYNNKWNFTADAATGDYIILYAKWMQGRQYILINRNLTQPIEK